MSRFVVTFVVRVYENMRYMNISMVKYVAYCLSKREPACASLFEQ